MNASDMTRAKVLEAAAADMTRRVVIADAFDELAQDLEVATSALQDSTCNHNALYACLDRIHQRLVALGERVHDML